MKAHNSNKTMMSSDIGDQGFANGLGLVGPAQVAMAEPVVETPERDPTEPALDSVPAETETVEKKKAVDDLLAHFEQTVIPQIASDLAVRDRRAAELTNLQAGYKKTQAEIEDFKRQITALVEQSDDVLKAGGSLGPINEKIEGINAKAKIAEALLLHLDRPDEAHRDHRLGVIPTAKQNLYEANLNLKYKVQRVMLAEVHACEGRMNDSFSQGMDYYDEFIQGTGQFYRMYKIDLNERANENGPKPRENRLWYLMDSRILLR